jgi:hypothetical protein
VNLIKTYGFATQIDELFGNIVQASAAYKKMIRLNIQNGFIEWILICHIQKVLDHGGCFANSSLSQYDAQPMGQIVFFEKIPSVGSVENRQLRLAEPKNIFHESIPVMGLHSYLEG